MITQRVRASVFLALLLVPLVIGGCSLSPSGRAPLAEIDASRETGHAPLDVTFDASRSTDDGQIVSYEWTFQGDASPIIGPRCTYTFRTPGTCSVTLTVVDKDGNSASAHIDIVIENSPPVASFRLSDDAPIVNRPMTVDGSGSYDPEGATIEFSWAFGDGASAQGPTAGHTYTSEGTFTVTLTVRDPAGGESVASHDVLVHRATPGGGCSGGTPIPLGR